MLIDALVSDGTRSILFYVSNETLCSKQLKIDGKFEDVYCNPRPLEAPQKFLLALAASAHGDSELEDRNNFAESFRW
jgi:hypothetical protein